MIFIYKKKSFNNKDIYSLENNGAYFYSGGWHIKGIYSLILGFIFSASTIWNSNLNVSSIFFMDNWSICCWISLLFISKRITKWTKLILILKIELQ